MLNAQTWPPTTLVRGASGRPPVATARGRLRWLRRSERGQAMVEFTLIVPMLLVIVFGIAEFGFLLTNQISLTNAAREGARTGALEGSTAAAAVSQAQTAGTGLTSCPLQTPTATYSGGTPNEVTVTVKCTYTPVTPLAPLIKFMGGSINTGLTLTTSATMRVEQ